MKKALAAVLLSGIATLSIAAFAGEAQPNPCIIVRNKDGHTMLNLFLFGPPGLLVTATAKYSTVDSFNLPSAKASYTGNDLRKLSSNNVHVVVVNHKPEAEEVAAARISCIGSATGGKPENLTALGIVIDTNPANLYAGITLVVHDGAGDRAGLRVGYVITTVNGVPARNVLEVSQAVGALPPDTTTITLGYGIPSNLGYLPKEMAVRLKR